MRYNLIINNDLSWETSILQLSIFLNDNEGDRVSQIFINLMDVSRYQIKYHLMSGQQINNWKNCFSSSNKSKVFRETIKRLFSFDVGNLRQI